MRVRLAPLRALSRRQKLAAVQVNIVPASMLGLRRVQLMLAISLVVLSLRAFAGACNISATPKRHHCRVVDIGAGGQFIPLNLIVDSLMDSLRPVSSMRRYAIEILLAAGVS